MPLVIPADIERELNITLTDPNGPETVNHLIASVISWAEKRVPPPALASWQYATFLAAKAFDIIF